MWNAPATCKSAVIRLLQPHRWQVATALPRPGLIGFTRCPPLRAPAHIASPTRVHVISVASPLPQDQDRTVTRWTLDEIAATLLDDLDTDAISRSSIWRILHEVDLKPHKSEYWLNSHDEDFEAKAHAICQLYVKALEAYQQGRLVICCDEKTGMQVLERKAPTKPAQPGRRERREHEYIRHGTRVLINSLAVATGQIAWTIGATRKSHRFCGPSQARLPTLTPDEALRLDHGQLEYPLEPGGLSLGGRWCKVPFDLTSCQKGSNAGRF